jgi:hypothetical protein
LDMHLSSEECAVFDVSTFMVLGDGVSALFWEDRWLDGEAIRELAMDLYALIPKRLRRRRTVRQALMERCWITDIAGALSPLGNTSSCGAGCRGYS